LAPGPPSAARPRPKRLAAPAIGGDARGQGRIEAILKRVAKLKTEVLPTVALALEQAAEPIGPARRAHAAALAEVDRHDEIAAAHNVVAAARRADAAMEALTAALADRDEAVEQFAETARTQTGKEFAYRLTTSSNLDIAWAFHGLPGAVEIPERDLRSLAQIDAELLRL
jgi:hypothetical protein